MSDGNNAAKTQLGRHGKGHKGICTIQPGKPTTKAIKQSLAMWVVTPHPFHTLIIVTVGSFQNPWVTSI